MSLRNCGDGFHELVAKVVNPDVVISDHRLSRTAGLYLEECIELALACGLSTTQILGHVQDALYNEGRKLDQFPTDIEPVHVPSANLENITMELGDTGILHDYVRFLANIKESQIQSYQVSKLELLNERAKAGELKEHDELIYKTSLNRS